MHSKSAALSEPPSWAAFSQGGNANINVESTFANVISTVDLVILRAFTVDNEVGLDDSQKEESEEKCSNFHQSVECVILLLLMVNVRWNL